jgi:hypothetical protein
MARAAGLGLPLWLLKSRPQSWRYYSGNMHCCKRSCGAAGDWAKSGQLRPAAWKPGSGRASRHGLCWSGRLKRLEGSWPPWARMSHSQPRLPGPAGLWILGGAAFLQAMPYT